MPHVASALKNHAHRPPAHAARPAPAADRTPAAPFASLLDDSAPGPERSPQPAPDDNPARAARSDQAQQPAKSTDSKAAKTKDDASSAEPGKDAKSNKTDAAVKAAGDGKAAADAEIVKPTDGKDGKPVSDGKAADSKAIDGRIPVDVAAATPIDPVPTITPADAIASALAPTPAVVATTAPAAEDAATVATVATPTTPDALAALQAGNVKAADDQALTTKTAASSHGEVKPQGTTSDADKDAIAQARDELARGELTRGEPADTAHHAAGAQAQATLTADTNTAAPRAGADAAPPTVLTAPPQNTAPTEPNPAASAPAPQPAAIPFAGVAIEIAGKALAGKNHFEIRLDPPELGRIEVRLDVDRDGNVTSRMIADRADTLDLLRRDAGGLERALQDAGLKTSDNGLQFSLRDQSAHQQQASGADTARLVVEDEMLPAIDTTPRSYSRLAGLGGGVDIHV